MSHQNTNRVLPPGSQFSAIVNGKPTGLAGCTRCDECERKTCLRADPGLRTRFDMANGRDTAVCAYFIPRG